MVFLDYIFGIRVFRGSLKTKEDLDLSVDDFAYGWYNHVRPHTYNVGGTPYAARVAYVNLYAGDTTLFDHDTLVFLWNTPEDTTI